MFYFNKLINVLLYHVDFFSIFVVLLKLKDKNMKKNKILFNAVLLFVIIILSQSFSYSQITVGKNRDKWVPEDFNPTNTVLLIENFSKINKKGKDIFAKENEKLKKFMQESYTYQYEFSDDVTLSNAKYADLNKYPYAIVFGSEFADRLNESSHLTSSEGITCSIYDRKNNKYLPSNGVSTSYAHGVFESVINGLLKIYNKRVASIKK